MNEIKDLSKERVLHGEYIPSAYSFWVNYYKNAKYKCQKHKLLEGMGDCLHCWIEEDFK